MATPATPLDLSLTSAPITMLVPGDNPRRKKPADTYVDEMAQSMRSLGVIEPLVVRWHPKQAGVLQIIAGETRFTAAQRADLKDVPIVVKDWNDDQVLEAQLVENIQRNAMHAIDEGEAFKRLIERKKYTAEDIAKKVGKSVRWVYNRLEFTKLIPSLREAFLADEITVSHAELLARLEPADQERADNKHDPRSYSGNALWRWDSTLFEAEDGKEKRQPRRSPVSIRDLNDWIEHNVRLAIQTDAVQRLLPEIDDAQVEAAATNARILQIATVFMLPQEPQLKKRFEGVLTDRHWKRAGGRSLCDFTERGVIVFGDGQGDVIDVCVNKKQCAKHWPEHQPAAVEKRRKRAAKSGAAAPAQDNGYARQEAERRQREARWEVLRPALTKATTALVGGVKKVPASMLVAALDRLNLPKTDKVEQLPNLLLQAAIRTAFENSKWHGREPELTKFLNAIGVDVKAVVKSVDKSAPAKSADAPAKKAPKPAKPINWKTHFAKSDKPKKAAKPAAAKKAPAKRKAGKKR